MADVRAMTRAEGEAVVAYLREMPADAWDRTTVCDPWAVGHLVAHLTALGNQTMGNFAKGFIRSGFSFDKFVNRDMQQYLVGSPQERIDRLEDSVKSPSTPDRLKEIALGEMMCHGEDIRQALGDRGQHSPAHVSQVGPMYVEAKAPLNGKMRAAGLSFRATDGDWSHGSGPEVTGPGMDLLCAIVGRPYALDHLEGDGLATLRSRL
ncbi:MAG: maleylpyruvate isomerase family mycothiol-dependent enzyme [Acidimicrobiales bacterium]